MLTRALALALFVFPAFASAETPAILFTTEEFAPYHFSENGEIKGSGTDQIREIMRRAELPFSIEIMSWSRAIELAERRANACVFTTAHTEERSARFKWVEPLFTDTTSLVQRKGSNVEVTSLEEALEKRIGTQTGDYTVEILQDLGAAQIDEARLFDNSLRKLDAGRIDYVITSPDAVAELQVRYPDLEASFTVSEEVFSIACSKQTPDAAIAAMQRALDSIVADGSQKRIVDSYR